MTDPEPVHSVRLNGVECEAIDAADVETMGDDSDECSAPADRHWRYCCGNLLSSPPPRCRRRQYLNIPRAFISVASFTCEPIGVQHIERASEHVAGSGRSESAAWYERLESIIAVGAFAIVASCSAAFAKMSGHRQSSLDADSPSDRVEAGVSHRKRTLLTPWADSRDIIRRQNGSVVRGAGTSTQTVANARVGAASVGEQSTENNEEDVLARPMTFPGAGASSLFALSSTLAPDQVSEIQLKDVCLGEMLGQGAYGTVHRGEWKKDGEDDVVLVAVKTLHAMTGVSRQEMRAFTREVAVLSRLDHKGIVRLLGACLRLPHVCIVEELMQGGSLWGFIHGDGSCRFGRRLTYEETLRVAKGCCGCHGILVHQGNHPS